MSDRLEEIKEWASKFPHGALGQARVNWLIEAVECLREISSNDCHICNSTFSRHCSICQDIREAKEKGFIVGRLKVFVVSSKKVFWGKGAAVSFEGRDILTTMASFLKHMPNRVVISENGPEDEKSEQYGLARAWAVLQFLTEEQGLDKKRFSISGASTLPKNRFENGLVNNGFERAIEIVLLERSIYN